MIFTFSGLELVELHPLAVDAARLEPLLRDPEVIEREQVRDAGQPRVRRLADDHVVAAVRCREVVAAVVVDHRRAAARARTGTLAARSCEVVDVGEEARRLGDRALELDHLDRAHRELQRRADGHARAEARSSRRRGRARPCRCSSSGSARDHDLRRHVVAVAGVDLAVVLERVVAAPALDRDRGRQAVAVVERGRARPRSPRRARPWRARCGTRRASSARGSRRARARADGSAARAPRSASAARDDRVPGRRAPCARSDAARRAGAPRREQRERDAG